MPAPSVNQQVRLLAGFWHSRVVVRRLWRYPALGKLGVLTGLLSSRFSCTLAQRGRHGTFSRPLPCSAVYQDWPLSAPDTSWLRIASRCAGPEPARASAMWAAATPVA